MIIFAIPLRGKETANNWEHCLKLLNNTLKSIFNQTNPNFKCIIACNDELKLDRQYDERVEVIRMDLPVPQGWLEMAHDKFWKLLRIAVRAREILETQKQPENGIYVMPVDADDYLNRNIAAWCEMHPNEYGAVSKDGYVWNGSNRFARIYKEMHTYCGSCNIIKMYREDLPESMPYSDDLCHDTATAKILNRRYPIRFDHNKVVEYYRNIGKPFATLPFRSTIYVLGHGDNISSIYHKQYGQLSEKRFHPIAFLRSLNVFERKVITKGFMKDFGME